MLMLFMFAIKLTSTQNVPGGNGNMIVKEDEITSLIKEEKRLLSEIEISSKFKIKIKSRFLKLRNHNINDHNKQDIVNGVCLGFCNNKMAGSLHVILSLNESVYKDMYIENTNNWMSLFSGSSYVGVILKLAKMDDITIISIHRTETEDRLLIHKVFETVGSAWIKSEYIVSSLISTIYEALVLVMYVFVFLFIVIICAKVDPIRSILINLFCKFGTYLSNAIKTNIKRE